jgi:hypothetical protein
MTDTKPMISVQLVNCLQIFNAITTHIHGGKSTIAFWAGMPQHKTPYSRFQQAYKNRIKVFPSLAVPRIQPKQDDDFFRRRGSNFGRRESVDAPDEDFAAF